MRIFKTWEELKEAYGWVGNEPIAKVAKHCFEVKLVQRYDESDADFKKRVEAAERGGVMDEFTTGRRKI